MLKKSFNKMPLAPCFGLISSEELSCFPLYKSEVETKACAFPPFQLGAVLGLQLFTKNQLEALRFHITPCKVNSCTQRR